MKKFFCVFCLLIISMNAYSESVFIYDLKKDIIIGALSIGVFVSPFFFNNQPIGLVVLEKSNVNAFDRALMFSYNKTLDKISDYGVYALLMFPVISLAGQYKDLNAWLTYGIMYTEAFLLTFGTKDLLKNLIIRYRPYMYYDTGIPMEKVNDWCKSFPSGSSALAFLSAGFLSATFSAEYPDSPWKVPVIAGIYTLAGGVAACRIVSGSHFMTDVLTGAAIGSLYGWLIPVLHKRQNSNNNVTINFIGNGFIAAIKY